MDTHTIVGGLDLVVWVPLGRPLCMPTKPSPRARPPLRLEPKQGMDWMEETEVVEPCEWCEDWEWVEPVSLRLSASSRWKRS